MVTVRVETLGRSETVTVTGLCVMVTVFGLSETVTVLPRSEDDREYDRVMVRIVSVGCCCCRAVVDGVRNVMRVDTRDVPTAIAVTVSVSVPIPIPIPSTVGACGGDRQTLSVPLIGRLNFAISPIRTEGNARPLATAAWSSWLAYALPVRRKARTDSRVCLLGRDHGWHSARAIKRTHIDHTSSGCWQDYRRSLWQPGGQARGVWKETFWGTARETSDGDSSTKNKTKVVPGAAYASAGRLMYPGRV